MVGDIGGGIMYTGGSQYCATQNSKIQSGAGANVPHPSHLLNKTVMYCFINDVLKVLKFSTCQGSIFQQGHINFRMSINQSVLTTPSMAM